MATFEQKGFGGFGVSDSGGGAATRQRPRRPSGWDRMTKSAEEKARDFAAAEGDRQRAKRSAELFDRGATSSSSSSSSTYSSSIRKRYDDMDDQFAEADDASSSSSSSSISKRVMHNRMLSDDPDEKAAHLNLTPAEVARTDGGQGGYQFGPFGRPKKGTRAEHWVMASDHTDYETEEFGTVVTRLTAQMDATHFDAKSGEHFIYAADRPGFGDRPVAGLSAFQKPFSQTAPMLGDRRFSGVSDAEKRIAQFVPFFGMPREQPSLDPYHNFGREQFDLPDAYLKGKGQNAYNNHIIFNAVMAADMWYTGLMAPFIVTDVVGKIVWESMEFLPTMLDRVPYRTVPRLVLSRSKSREQAMLRFGKALEAEWGFFLTKEGQMRWGMGIKQIIAASWEFFAFMAITAVLTAEKWADTLFEKRRRAMERKEFFAALEAECDQWGGIQKEEMGFDNTCYRMIKQLKERGIDTASSQLLFVLPAGARYYTASQPEKNKFQLTGVPRDTPRSEETISIRGATWVKEGKTFMTDADSPPLDPMFDVNNIGDWFLVSGCVKSRNCGIQVAGAGAAAAPAPPAAAAGAGGGALGAALAAAAVPVVPALHPHNEDRRHYTSESCYSRVHDSDLSERRRVQLEETLANCCLWSTGSEGLTAAEETARQNLAVKCFSKNFLPVPASHARAAAATAENGYLPAFPGEDPTHAPSVWSFYAGSTSCTNTRNYIEQFTNYLTTDHLRELGARYTTKAADVAARERVAPVAFTGVCMGGRTKSSAIYREVAARAAAAIHAMGAAGGWIDGAGARAGDETARLRSNIAYLLKAICIDDWTFIKFCLDKNVPLHMACCGLRPNIQHKAGQFIAMIPGLNTIATYLGNPDAQAGQNTKIKVYSMAFTLNAACLITNERNIMVDHAPYIVEYIRGGALNPFTPADRTTILQQQLYTKDVYYVWLPPWQAEKFHEEHRGHLDITGHYPKQFYDDSRDEHFLGHYATSADYSEYWGWNADTMPDLMELTKLSLKVSTGANTICHRSHYIMSNGLGTNGVMSETLVTGRGHRGSRLTAGFEHSLKTVKKMMPDRQLELPAASSVI